MRLTSLFSSMFLVMAALVLLGCGVPLKSTDYAQTAEGKLFNAVYEAVLYDDRELLKSRLPKSWASNTNLDNGITFIQTSLSANKIKFAQFIGWSSHTSLRDGRTSELSALFQYDKMPDHWVHVTAQYIGPSENLSISDIKVQQIIGAIDLPQEGWGLALDFKSFVNLSFVQFAIFILTIFSIAVTVFAFFTCILSKQTTFKWAWSLPILIGFCPVTHNFITGTTRFDPLSIILFGGGISPYIVKSGFYILPWFPIGYDGAHLIIFSVPIGAIVFLWRTYLLFRRFKT